MNICGGCGGGHGLGGVVGGGHGGFAAFFNAGVHTVSTLHPPPPRCHCCRHLHHCPHPDAGDVPLLFPLCVWTEDATLPLVEEVRPFISFDLNLSWFIMIILMNRRYSNTEV